MNVFIIGNIQHGMSILSKLLNAEAFPRLRTFFLRNVGISIMADVTNSKMLMLNCVAACVSPISQRKCDYDDF